MKAIKIVFVAVVAVLILLLLPRLLTLTPEAILSYTPRSLPLAALVFIGIYASKSILMFIPTYGLYIAAGMLFPLPMAFGVAYVGLGCELMLGYAIGRWLGRDKVLELMNKNAKAKKFITFLDSNSQMVSFVTRVLPMPYPVDLGSMFFGATGMSFWKHLLFSLCGLSLIMIPTTIAGQNVHNPLSPEFLIPLSISFGAMVVLFIVYLVWQRKRKKKAAGAPPQEGAPGPEGTGTPGKNSDQTL